MSAWNAEAQQPSARVHSRVLMQQNALCFSFVIATYFLMILLVNYFGLLSLIMYRYVSAPLRPLWHIRKGYFHLGVVLYTSAFCALLIHYRGFTSEAVGGTCGPSFGEEMVMVAVAIPQSIALAVFCALTPLNVRHMTRHMAYTKKMSSEPVVDRDLLNLYRRLVVYSVSMASAIILLLFVTVSSFVRLDDIERLSEEYVECLLTNFQKKAMIAENGDITEQLADVCGLCLVGV